MNDTPPATVHPLAWMPNALTTARMLLIPVLVIGILMLGLGSTAFIAKPMIIMGLFIIATVTDFLDGFLARRWNVVSDFGRMIDPIADKLLVAGCLIALAVATKGSWFIMVPALAIIGRDILVSGAREHAALSGRVMPPTNLAKWKTACEMLGIGILIIWLSARSYLPIGSVIPPFAEWSGRTGLAFIWLAAILSVYTGSLYFRAALKKI